MKWPEALAWRLDICDAFFGVRWLASALFACGLPQALGLKRTKRYFVG